MAVIIRKRIHIAGEEAIIEAYLPEGKIDKGARLQANELDNYLSENVPGIYQKIAKEHSREKNLVEFWYQLGTEIRRLIDESSLVLAADIESGDFWQAIWHFIPIELRPARGEERDYADLQQKRKDILSLCYEISAFSWDAVSWLRRWDDWHQICFRPGIIRDKRILIHLGQEVSKLPKYPSTDQFRRIVKELGDFFSTKDYKDSVYLDDEMIRSKVKSVVRSI